MGGYVARVGVPDPIRAVFRTVRGVSGRQVIGRKSTERRRL